MISYLQGFPVKSIYIKLPLILYSDTSQVPVTDEAPNSVPGVWQCAAWWGPSHTAWGGDRWAWSDGGIVISGGKQKNWERNLLHCSHPSRTSLEFDGDWIWVSVLRNHRSFTWDVASLKPAHDVLIYFISAACLVQFYLWSTQVFILWFPSASC
jgi:hypothetical protein